MGYLKTGTWIDFQNSGVGKDFTAFAMVDKTESSHVTCLRLPSHYGKQLFLLFTSFSGTFETPTQSRSDWLRIQKSKITSVDWYPVDLNYPGESWSPVISK